MPKHDYFSHLPMMEGSSPQSKIDPGLVAYGATSPAGYALGTEENTIIFSFNISGIILWFLTNVPVTTDLLWTTQGTTKGSVSHVRDQYYVVQTQKSQGLRLHACFEND